MFTSECIIYSRLTIHNGYIKKKSENCCFLVDTVHSPKISVLKKNLYSIDELMKPIKYRGSQI